MRKLVIFTLLIVVLAISVSLLAYLLVLSPENINGGTSPTTTRLIELEGYSGWKGVESMITPLDEYVKTMSGVTGLVGDLLWPYADSQNPFRDSLNRGGWCSYCNYYIG